MANKNNPVTQAVNSKYFLIIFILRFQIKILKMKWKTKTDYLIYLDKIRLFYQLAIVFKNHIGRYRQPKTFIVKVFFREVKTS